MKIHLAYRASNERPIRPAFEPVVAAATVVVPVLDAALAAVCTNGQPLCISAGAAYAGSNHATSMKPTVTPPVLLQDAVEELCWRGGW